MKSMRLLRLDGEFSVSKLVSAEGLDLNRPYVFLSITDDEISYVCPSALVPAEAIVVESGWRALKIDGELDFGLVGVLAEISGLLAAEGISLFAISTYNTDYILLKKHDFERAGELLALKGHEVV